MKRALVLGALAALGVVSIAGTAAADDNDLVAKSQPGVVWMKDYVVYGKRMRPMAVVDLARQPMTLTLDAEKHLLSDRMDDVVTREPF